MSETVNKELEAANEADAKFKEMIGTPLERDEAEKMLADNDIQLAQLRVLRIRKVNELNQIDHEIEMANFDRSVIFRRSLNVSDKKAEFGKIVDKGE